MLLSDNIALNGRWNSELKKNDEGSGCDLI
jgi:hypothetical protein